MISLISYSFSAHPLLDAKFMMSPRVPGLLVLRRQIGAKMTAILRKMAPILPKLELITLLARLRVPL